MSYTVVPPQDRISVALLEHLGIPEGKAIAITYHHEVNCLPTVTVKMELLDDDGEVAIDFDKGEIATETVRYEWRRVNEESD